jgi:hypothetical protein
MVPSMEPTDCDNWWELSISEQEEIADGIIHNTITVPSEKLLNRLNYSHHNINTFDGQLKSVKNQIEFIRKENTRNNFKDTYLPIMNIIPNQFDFKVEILSFDGKTRRQVNAMLDSGAYCGATIGENAANDAGIVRDRYGRLSFAYVITVNDKEFLCYSLAYENDNKVKHTYIERSRCVPGVVSCQGETPNKWIDLLIGYQTLKEMSERGIYLTALNNNEINPLWKSIPFSNYSGLGASINNRPVKFSIDSGMFINTDLIIPINFFYTLKHKKDYLFNDSCLDCGAKKCERHGVINNFGIHFGEINVVFKYVTFEIVNTEFTMFKQEQKIQIVGTRYFMKNSLPENGLIPKLY